VIANYWKYFDFPEKYLINLNSINTYNRCFITALNNECVYAYLFIVCVLLIYMCLLVVFILCTRVGVSVIYFLFFYFLIVRVPRR